MRINKKAKKCCLLSGSFLLTAGLLTACNSEAEDDEWQHAHISGPTDSGWYPLSTLFSDIWLDELEEADVTVVEGAAIGNIREVNTGVDVQTGFAFVSDFVDGINGEGGFEGEPQENVKALGAFYPTFWNIAVLEDSPYESLEDVVEYGADVIPGNPGDASVQTFHRIFEAMGYDEEDLEEAGVSVDYGGYGDAANQMRDGIIDLTIQGGGPYVPGLTEIDATQSVELLSIPEEVLDELEEQDYGYTTDLEIPANSYSAQPEDIPTVVTWAMMIVHEDMDDDVVYELTKAIWENVDRVEEEQPTRGEWFDPEFAYGEIDDPEENIHPGALRYYEEVGATD
ncbi:TAXI family TRAP transporter solute-binding subunit [Salicibibacter cibi]|uniref:TAXI family TRAP transporter solute-binding subunit n=1 Tax=Salicibibacter cibi TaxID=2743001 RepID=A0A7T6ZB99_9BACI|nr:TAXI family TRAP transporter solute-binding subunit [Salicibibacter cibi]QQK80278.1 TAXI family TRAP transporter solute-binding subunit [Salicibibacter cibi]